MRKEVSAMPARLLRPLRDAVLSGVAVLAILLVIDYVRADTPEWGLYLMASGIYAATHFGFRAFRRGNDAKSSQPAERTPSE
jgi:hypothetical protein